MPRQDVQCEWAYYGGTLDVVGMLYFRPVDLPAKQPDVLFFLMYLCRLLTDKKMAITNVNEILRNLDHTAEEWERILNWEEDRPFTCPCRMIPYRGYSRSAFSASVLMKEKLYFRSARMGFGFFSNGKHFTRCAVGSVFSLLETMYNANSKEAPEDAGERRRRTNGKQRETLALLFRAASAVSRLDMGQDLARGNCDAVAVNLYRALTGDDYPNLTQFPKLSNAAIERAAASAAATPEERAIEREKRRREAEARENAEGGTEAE